MSTELLLEKDERDENRTSRFHRLFQTGLGHGVLVLPYLDRSERRAICATSYDMHTCIHRDKLGKILCNYYRFPIESVIPYLENKMYLVESEGKMRKMKAVKNDVWEFSCEFTHIYIHKERVAKMEQIDLDVEVPDFFDEEQNFMDICDRHSYKCSNCLFCGCVTGIAINICIFQHACVIQ